MTPSSWGPKLAKFEKKWPGNIYFCEVYHNVGQYLLFSKSDVYRLLPIAKHIFQDGRQDGRRF